MKLLIIGTLEGHMTGASQIAIQRGAKVAAVDAIDQGLEHLRNGKGADVVLIDVRLNIERLCKALLAERINTPVVACGMDGTDAQTAAAAIRRNAPARVRSRNTASKASWSPKRDALMLRVSCWVSRTIRSAPPSRRPRAASA